MFKAQELCECSASQSWGCQMSRIKNIYVFSLMIKTPQNATWSQDQRIRCQHTLRRNAQALLIFWWWGFVDPHLGHIRVTAQYQSRSNSTAHPHTASLELLPPHIFPSGSRAGGNGLGEDEANVSPSSKAKNQCSRQSTNFFTSLCHLHSQTNQKYSSQVIC